MFKLVEALMIIAKSLERQAVAQERIASALEEQQLPEVGDRAAAAALLGVSPRTVSNLHSDWVEGIHFNRVGKRISYNLVLLRDWKVNKGTPAHQRAIERWCKQLPSNHKKRA